MSHIPVKKERKKERKEKKYTTARALEPPFLSQHFKIIA